jgi:hypothetical protein
MLHVTDIDPTSLSANGWLEDVSKVKKYEMSEEEYERRDNTYRRYKEQKLKVGEAVAAGIGGWQPRLQGALWHGITGRSSPADAADWELASSGAQ